MKHILTLLFLILHIPVFSQNFEIYVSDAGNFNSPPWQILKFDQNGQTPVVFINTNLNWPQDILFLEDSNVVLISNLGSGRITKHHATTGVFISDFATGIAGPTRMKIGPDGFLYVLQWNGNGKVRRYEFDGSYIGEFTSVGVPQSIGIDWDANGNLYVSSYSADLVRKFDTNGIDQGIFINSNLTGPTNIWFDTNGELLVTDYDGNAVKRFDANGNFMGNFISGLSQCEGVDFFPNGNILIGNGGTSSVKMFDSAGTYLQEFISSGSGNLLTPNAIVIRQIIGSGINEAISEKKNIIYPSMGIDFYISPGFQQQVELIYFYDITGSLVKVFHHILNQPMSCGELAGGVYVCKIKLIDGTELVQKVIVQLN